LGAGDFESEPAGERGEGMNLEIGVIEKRSEPAFAVPWTVTASDGFAASIAGRYLGNERTVSRAELALAYQTPGEVHFSQEAQIHIAPQVHWREQFLFAPVRREVVHQSTSAAARQVTRLYERLFSRQERVMSFGPSFANAPASGAFEKTTEVRQAEMRPLAEFSSRPVAPVERIVRESARPVEVRQTASPRGADSDSGWGTPLAPPAAPAPVSLPAAEVKRVTEQVIREIDHRIVARRERLERRS
jgi:hypothetical protein